MQEPILYELVEKRPWSPKKYEFVEKRPWSPGKRNYDWARLSKRADNANYEGKYVYKTTNMYRIHIVYRMKCLQCNRDSHCC